MACEPFPASSGSAGRLAGRAGRTLWQRIAESGSGRRPPGRTAVGAVARIVAVVQPRWSRAVVRDADYRHRRAHRSLRQPLPRRPRPGEPLLCLAVRVHGRDARRRPQRQHPDAVRVLGAHGLYVVPAHRLRTRAGRCSISRNTGVDRHRRGRSGASGGRCPARRRGGHGAASRQWPRRGRPF